MVLNRSAQDSRQARYSEIRMLAVFSSPQRPDHLCGHPVSSPMGNEDISLEMDVLLLRKEAWCALPSVWDLDSDSPEGETSKIRKRTRGKEKVKLEDLKATLPSINLNLREVLESPIFLTN
ncbi:uncharacterized protein LOC110834377 isoform X2 [Zootermopsis nevadensis]|uniref:uncharacterized protein LOC110834377 isoform X2 n=1 Tax=Zootermopsis nevadensis TaxID=136037 RepID=UPI000B8E37E5|nr:uncharacterized protein LOC110834377 isoform X2 [Zootermopsis nevadensis]